MIPAERREAIQKIEALAAQIEALIDGRPESDLDKTYREGSWTARQLIHHLAESHMHSYIRTHFILTEEKPPLKPYDQDLWSKLPDAKIPVTPSVEILRGLHTRWTVFWKTLPEAAFSRTGYHPERADVSLDDLLRIYAGHGVKHLEHIRTAINS
jgi:hypothetical protein